MPNATHRHPIRLFSLLACCLLAAPLVGVPVRVQAQGSSYKSGDIVEVKWIDKWVLARVDTCLNAYTCTVHFYDAASGAYAANLDTISTDHIRATANRPVAKATPSGQVTPGPAAAAPVRPTSRETVPAAAECTFEVPGTPVSRTAPASAALFQRVIYDWFAIDVKEGGTTNPLRVGITFLEFQMAAPFVNRVVVDPGTGAHRLHDGAPTGAMIYSVKSRYALCRGYRGEIIRQVVQENFACFNDKFGDWVCPADNARTILESKSLPIPRV